MNYVNKRNQTQNLTNWKKKVHEKRKNDNESTILTHSLPTIMKSNSIIKNSNISCVVENMIIHKLKMDKIDKLCNNLYGSRHVACFWYGISRLRKKDCFRGKFAQRSKKRMLLWTTRRNGCYQKTTTIKI